MSKFLPNSAFSFIQAILKKVKKTKLIALILFCVFGQSLFVILPGLLGVLIDRIFVLNIWNISWLVLFPGIWFISVIFTAIGKFYISNITQDARKFSKELI